MTESYLWFFWRVIESPGYERIGSWLACVYRIAMDACGNFGRKIRGFCYKFWNCTILRWKPPMKDNFTKHQHQEIYLPFKKRSKISTNFLQLQNTCSRFIMLELMFAWIYDQKIAWLFVENSENCAILKQNPLRYNTFGTYQHFNTS